jgi:hypothetical protein
VTLLKFLASTEAETTFEVGLMVLLGLMMEDEPFALKRLSISALD